ncbi:hypothetical protein SCOR_07445 [Sulfidibacter corallicola]
MPWQGSNAFFPCHLTAHFASFSKRSAKYLLQTLYPPSLYGEVMRGMAVARKVNLSPSR